MRTSAGSRADRGEEQEASVNTANAVRINDGCRWDIWRSVLAYREVDSLTIA
jgi:hypothetical protein